MLSQGPVGTSATDSKLGQPALKRRALMEKLPRAAAIRALSERLFDDMLTN
jgi:hypothetical protein